MSYDAVAKRLEDLQAIIDDAMNQAEFHEAEASFAHNPVVRKHHQTQVDVHWERAAAAEYRIEQIKGAIA